MAGIGITHSHTQMAWDHTPWRNNTVDERVHIQKIVHDESPSPNQDEALE